MSDDFKYFVIFPGGNWKPKIWSIKNYNSLLIKILSQNKNIKFILVGSKSEEENYLNEITKNIDSNKIINLFGASLTQTAAYMKKSKLFIGNDSGLSHMASATKLKSIVLFGPTNDVIYGPFMRNGELTSEGDRKFHVSLTQTDPDIGYKDDLDMQTLFSNSGLSCLEKVEMPANNLAFVLKKDSLTKQLKGD